MHKSKVKKSRIEIAVLIGTLTAAGASTIAGLAPAVFACLGIGALSGASVLQLGSLASTGLLQVAQQLHPKDDENAEVAPAAMFHQIEEKLGTKWRSDRVDK